MILRTWGWEENCAGDHRLHPETEHLPQGPTCVPPHSRDQAVGPSLHRSGGAATGERVLRPTGILPADDDGRVHQVGRSHPSGGDHCKSVAKVVLEQWVARYNGPENCQDVAYDPVHKTIHHPVPRHVDLLLRLRQHDYHRLHTISSWARSTCVVCAYWFPFFQFLFQVFGLCHTLTQFAAAE